jgi:hypothetical protein
MLRRKGICLVGGFVLVALLGGASAPLEAGANRNWIESLAAAPWWSRVYERLEARERQAAPPPAKCGHGSMIDPDGCPKAVPVKCDAGSMTDPNGCPRG